MATPRRSRRPRTTLLILVLASVTIITLDARGGFHRITSGLRTVAAIVDAVKVTLDRTPPELAADIMEQGIVLTGGGALLHGLESRLTQETGMPIVVARDPLNCVAIGSGQCLEEFEALKQVLITSSAR